MSKTDKKPTVSVIVPTRNSEPFLAACLQSIADQTYSAIELIVVDRNSKDATKKIARTFTKHVFNKEPERSAQRNFGASKATGDYIVFIDSDMELSPDVITECVEAMKHDTSAGVIIAEESFGEGFWARCKQLERSFYQGVDWMEAARFFRTADFYTSGGYNEKLTSGEDWDLSNRIGTQGSYRRIDSLIHHNEGKIRLYSTLKKKAYYASKITDYVDENSDSTSTNTEIGRVFKRFGLYFSQPVKLFRQPHIGLGMLFMKVSEFGVGFLAGSAHGRGKGNMSQNIVVVCFGDIIKPLNGYTIRTRMVVEKLAKENRVSVIQFIGTAEKEQAIGTARVHSVAVAHEKRSNPGLIERVIGFNPFKVIRFQIDNYRAVAAQKELLDDADVVYVEGCLLIGAFLKTRRLKKPITLDTHCINEDVAIKLKQHSKVKGLARQAAWHTVERFMIRRADTVIAVSENDKDFIMSHHKPKAAVEVLPNQVQEANRSKHAAAARKLKRTLRGKKYKGVVLFLGDLGAIQNKEAADFIASSLAPNHPNLRFVCIGNNPDNRTSRGNILFTGFVDDLDAHILAADVCIAPLAIGSGTKTKVLDYLKYDTTVVSTDVGVEGIDFAGKNVTVASLDEFSNALTKVVS